jgi:LPXTG-site transpeptidase (sortase) family protein
MVVSRRFLQGAVAAFAAAVLVMGFAPSALAAPPPAPPPDPWAPTTTTTKPAPRPTMPLPRKVASPRRLSVPSLGIDTKIYQVGLDKRKNVVIPEDIRRVGWYRLGVPPGVDRGNAVIVGHRDGSGYRKGAFYYLDTLKPGQVVSVTTSGKRTLKYRVESVKSILKKRLPYEKYFAVDGKHKLVLISCGGVYNRNNGGYQDNVIVTAEPLFTPIKVAPAKN